MLSHLFFRKQITAPTTEVTIVRKETTAPTMIFVQLGKGLLSLLASFMPSSVVEVMVVPDWFSLLVSVCASEVKGVVLVDVWVNETTVAFLCPAASEFVG